MRARPAAADKPALMLMTGLPIIWGETGPFDPDSRPAAAYPALQREFDIRPLDHLDDRSLGQARLMLLAQPRLLEPTELVALDAWVRRGGRLLILADPDLAWPTGLPLGDVRRPPSTSLLMPLLDHWGVRLERAQARRLWVGFVRDGDRPRRLALAAPGRWIIAGGRCRTVWRGLLAECRQGLGRALLLADADLLHDALWTAPRPRGAERHARLADNPLVIAALLDRMAGSRRERAELSVIWLAPTASRRLALFAALVPILVPLGGAARRDRN
jgi:hypothetical protein